MDNRWITVVESADLKSIIKHFCFRKIQFNVESYIYIYIYIYTRTHEGKVKLGRSGRWVGTRKRGWCHRHTNVLAKLFFLFAVHGSMDIGGSIRAR